MNWTDWIYAFPNRGGGGSHRPPISSVPEIDASSGLLAIAALVAVLALAWERSRRKT